MWKEKRNKGKAGGVAGVGGGVSLKELNKNVRAEMRASARGSYEPSAQKQTQTPLSCSSFLHALSRDAHAARFACRARSHGIWSPPALNKRRHASDGQGSGVSPAAKKRPTSYNPFKLS